MKEFTNHGLIKTYESIIDFFVDNKLSSDACQRKDEFVSWKLSIKNLFNLAKNYKKSDDLSKSIIDAKENIQLLKSEKNLTKMVEELLRLRAFTEQLKAAGNEYEDIEAKCLRINVASDAESFMVDIVTNIGKDLTVLFEFAFELRKQDVNNEHSYELLNGQVYPAILVDMIMSNKWDPKLCRMVLSKELNYRLILTVAKVRYTLCSMCEQESDM